MRIEPTIRKKLFQHTAARRRLPVEYVHKIYLEGVSTHSRPKAAASVAIQVAQ